MPSIKKNIKKNNIITDIDNILKIPTHSLVCSNYSACITTQSNLYYTNIITINRPICIYKGYYEKCLTELNSEYSYLCLPQYDNKLSQVLSEDTYIQTDSKDLVNNFNAYDGLFHVDTLKSKYYFYAMDYVRPCMYSKYRNRSVLIMVSVTVPFTIQ
eukprot:GHVR01008936.1.p1 GENE.GHVR01008936.1~~GHVR01008936.1.p1  ORF type:complete len:157 (+),score=22.96 GHVR01008936.1:1881-2351(+)